MTPQKFGIACSVMNRQTSAFGVKDNSENITSINIINAEYISTNNVIKENVIFPINLISFNIIISLMMNCILS